MAYAPHLRFQMGGELDPYGAGSWPEVWQCTINLTGTGDPDEDAWLTAQATALTSWFTASAQKMSALSRLSWIKLNQIGADGKYVDPSHPHTHSITPSVGTSTDTGYYPTFTSIAYSWTTGRLRGPGSHGRVYFPNAYSPVLQAADNITVSKQNAAATSAKGLLTILGTAAAGWTGVPVVSSKVDASNTPITGVRIGQLYDVQRRRKNKMPEAYVAATWP